MKNFIQIGDTIDFVAPSGGVTSGVPLIIGSFFIVPVATKLESETFAGVVEGVVSGMPKLSADVVAVGDKLNFNDATDELQKATSTLDGVVTATKAAGNGVTSVEGKLTPV